MGPDMVLMFLSAMGISIHPSRVGWDFWEHAADDRKDGFQSTHPVWDGTRPVSAGRGALWYFNPPIPCGMGRVVPDRSIRVGDFNPPIPCGMGPWRICRVHRGKGYFNPPIPCGMGLSARMETESFVLISIHPSRVGWDRRELVVEFPRTNFNPPIPCGMGPVLRFRRRAGC